MSGPEEAFSHTRCAGEIAVRVRIFSLGFHFQAGSELYAGRGIFAVVGREKRVFFGVLIGPKSVFCFNLVACNLEIYAAHRRLLLQ